MLARQATNSSFALRLRRLLAGLLAIASTLCGPGAAAAPAEKAVFAIAGVPTLGYAPLVFARETGLFAEEGLVLDIVTLQGSGEIIPQIVKGAVLTSLLAPDLLIQSRQPGRANFPLHFAYNGYRRSIWDMAVLDASPIRGIKDLKGKTIGVGALTFANVVQTKALLLRNGIEPGSVSFVAVGAGVPAFEALRRKQIDVLNLWDSALDAFTGPEPLRRLPYPVDVRSSSSHGLLFSDRVIAERPDLIARFGRALAKGTVACAANVDGCLEAHWRAYPAQKPRELDAATRARYRGTLQTVVDGMNAFRADTPPRFGAYASEDWAVAIDVLRTGGEISNAPITPSSLYTNDFVDQFNQFDVEAVKRKARAYR